MPILLLVVDNLLGVVVWNLLVYNSSLLLCIHSWHRSHNFIFYLSHAAAETAPDSEENDGDVCPVDDSHEVQHGIQRVHVDLLVCMDATAARMAGITVNFYRGSDRTPHRGDVK